MAVYDFTKLRRLLVIQLVVQLCLVLLLIAIAVLFQQKLGNAFLSCALFSAVIQLGAFFPLKKLAALEVDREIAAAAAGLTPADLQALRRKRMTADVIKTSVFVFFLIFILQLPDKPAILAMAYTTFILTGISYFQCFNFTAKKEMRSRSGK